MQMKMLIALLFISLSAGAQDSIISLWYPPKGWVIISNGDSSYTLRRDTVKHLDWNGIHTIPNDSFYWFPDPKLNTVKWNPYYKKRKKNKYGHVGIRNDEDTSVRTRVYPIYRDLKRYYIDILPFDILDSNSRRGTSFYLYDFYSTDYSDCGVDSNYITWLKDNREYGGDDGKHVKYSVAKGITISGENPRITITSNPSDRILSVSHYGTTGPWPDDDSIRRVYFREFINAYPIRPFQNLLNYLFGLLIGSALVYSIKIRKNNEK